MTLHPFSDTVSVQLASLERGMTLLAAFSDRYGDMKAFSCSPIGPTILFSSSAADDLRKRFGPEGWTVQGSEVHKEVDGITLSMALPKPEPQPFTL